MWWWRMTDDWDDIKLWWVEWCHLIINKTIVILICVKRDVLNEVVIIKYKIYSIYNYMKKKGEKTSNSFNHNFVIFKCNSRCLITSWVT